MASEYPFWHPMRHPDICGVILSAFSVSQVAALLSFHAENPSDNILGLFGHVSAFLWFSLFGPTASIGIIGLFALSGFFLRHDLTHCSKRYVLSFIGVLLSLSMILCLSGVLFPEATRAWTRMLGATSSSWMFPLGGLPMSLLYHKIPYISFDRIFSIVGTALLSSTALFICLILLFDIDLRSMWTKEKEDLPKKNTRRAPAAEKEVTPKEEEKPHRSVKFGQEVDVPLPKMPVFEGLEDEPFWPLASETAIPVTLVDKSVTPSNCSNYCHPSIELLLPGKKVDVSELKKELKEKADLLESTLLNFGIEAKVGQIHCGPTITMFEVHPAVGVKVGKIKTLEHDIALNMEAKSIRIIAPIPGKAAVGIEIPNQVPQEVNFRELLAAYQQRGTTFKIPMLLGKAVNGELVLTDLAKMPHCIIAGATGSGKSVCINSIVMSILMLARPDEIKFLMVDPKKVELAGYTELPHMLAPVITEPGMAAAALTWLVREMEKRYEILRITGHRNIDSFNKRTKDEKTESEAHIVIPEVLPYIVGIIDELADLMMVASQDVEAPIARIAQMARAIGIHLILATQRPSREVITGLIKANFPARISFKVASRVNSQIVLDDVGAETLLGNGDMLILLPGSSQPIRAQGAFIRDEEINAVISSISSQLPPNYVIGSPEKLQAEFQNEEDLELDDLFEEAKNLVLSKGKASTTYLQRMLKIGYARAASIMDQLEMQGIVSPQDGAKPREINNFQGRDNLVDTER